MISAFVLERLAPGASIRPLGKYRTWSYRPENTAVVDFYEITRDGCVTGYLAGPFSNETSSHTLYRTYPAGATYDWDRFFRENRVEE